MEFEHEMYLSENSHISGTIVSKDESFSHEFGVKQQCSYHVEDMRLFFNVLGHDMDITHTLSPAARANMSEKFLNDYFANNTPDEVA